MRRCIPVGRISLLFFFVGTLYLATNGQAGKLTLENPVDVNYLQTHLRKGSPRLLLTPELLHELHERVENDAVVSNYYRAIRLNAVKIMDQPKLERKQIGRRLLAVSREMLYRMGVLSIVYLVESDEAVLEKINDELVAVCNFSDWNPSHYLDVAEMSLAVAMAVDWVGEDLPQETVDLCLEALVEKGIQPSYDPKGNTGWIYRDNNWNQVCHAGMVAAAIAVADRAPELAAKTISRALNGIPEGLKAYLPDGVYPEGSTYWGYGTGFSIVTSFMLETAFGTDFGLGDFPGLKESADFRLLSNAPSGQFYNFADCGDRRSTNGDILLAWFAYRTGNGLYLESERFLQAPEDMDQLSRLAGPALIWLSQVEVQETSSSPKAWKGDGANPVVFFTDGGNGDYYLGAKGGRGTVNHGNMDAGSFVFELDGYRWVVDPGNQSYHELEKIGFDLWARCQDCERWTLLTKNNFGHSTLTVNDKLHHVDGFASIVDFQAGPRPMARLDMTPVFGEDLQSALRTFTRDGDRSLLIEDSLVLAPETDQVTWQLMTTAEVEIQPGKAILTHDGKTLSVENLSHPDLKPTVISLDPPPLPLDRHISGLKRIEFHYKDREISKEILKIRIRLVGE